MNTTTFSDAYLANYDFASPLTPSSRLGAIEALEATPDAVRELADMLSFEQMNTPYRLHGWTPAQVIHHIADGQLVGYARMRLAATQNNVPIANYPHNDWANLPDGKTPEVEPSLVLIDGLHQRIASFLRTLPHQLFAHAYQHPERGPITVERALGLYAWHGHHHVAVVRAALAL